MTTLFITPPLCLKHHPNSGHPESPDRLEAILKAIEAPEFSILDRKIAQCAEESDLALAHSKEHIREILNLIPEIGFNFIDNDTIVSPESGEAALHAVGAVLDAVDAVLTGKANNAFCAVRPPGHHAHRSKPGGFCLFNNIAIGAMAALKRHRLARVAIVDFDVHHGDGTQSIVWQEPGVFFASIHQSPLYPFTGSVDENGAFDNIINVPLQENSGGIAARQALIEKIIPRLNIFKPELILVSAGFDAHKDDPIGGLNWSTEDYAFLMTALLDAADRHCGGKLIAVLEGGYNTAALAESVAACLRAMIKNTTT
jgi:acetoin utilization deacetylase AcuC-like enzyme